MIDTPTDSLIKTVFILPVLVLDIIVIAIGITALYFWIKNKSHNKTPVTILLLPLAFILFLPLLSTAVSVPQTVYLERSPTHDLYQDGNMNTHLVITGPRFNDGANWKPVNLIFEKNKDKDKDKEWILENNTYKIAVYKNDTIAINYDGLIVQFKPNFFTFANSTSTENIDFGKEREISGNTVTWTVNSSKVNATVSYIFNADSVRNIVEIANSTVIDRSDNLDLVYEEEFLHGFENYNATDSYFRMNGQKKIKLENPKIIDKNKTIIDKIWNRKDSKFQASIEKNNSFPLTIDPDLTISGTTYQASGDLTFGTLDIQNNGVLQVLPYNGTAASGYINITAANITIETGGQINGIGAGYRGGAADGGGAGYDAAAHAEGPGNCTTPFNDPETMLYGGTAGGYGGQGGRGGASNQNNAPSAGAAYGTASGYDIERGSGGCGGGGNTGSGSGSPGSPGGALVQLNATVILNIQGIVNVTGTNGIGGNASGGGGGAGGGVLAQGVTVNTSGGTVDISGGYGGTGTTGGGGAGAGRFKLFYALSLSNTSFTLRNVAGVGQGSTNTGENGNTGTYTITQYNTAPTVLTGTHNPVSTAQYNFSRTYTFNSTVDDQNGQGDLSIAFLEQNFTGSSANSTMTCSQINSTARNCTLINSNLEKGRYQLRFLANDSVNAFGNSTPSYYIINDVGVPNITGQSTNPTSIFIGNSITFIANVSDDNSTVNSVHARISAPTFGARNYSLTLNRTVQTTYPQIYEYTATVPSQDITTAEVYTVRFFANDSENNLNQDSTRTATFTVDNAPTGGGGGGGGGVTIISKNISIKVLPNDVTIIQLSNKTIYQQFSIENKGGSVASPRIKFTGTHADWIFLEAFGSNITEYNKDLTSPEKAPDTVDIAPGTTAFALVKIIIPPGTKDDLYEIGMVVADKETAQGETVPIKVVVNSNLGIIQNFFEKINTQLLLSPSYQGFQRCGNNVCLQSVSDAEIPYFGGMVLFGLIIVSFIILQYLPLAGSFSIIRILGAVIIGIIGLFTFA